DATPTKAIRLTMATTPTFITRPRLRRSLRLASCRRPRQGEACFRMHKGRDDRTPLDGRTSRVLARKIAHPHEHRLATGVDMEAPAGSRISVLSTLGFAHDRVPAPPFSPLELPVLGPAIRRHHPGPVFLGEAALSLAPMPPARPTTY